jgi:hypothetical protein
MSAIGVQFHSTFEETFAFLLECAREMRLQMILSWRKPAFRVAVAESADEARSLVGVMGVPASIRLTVDSPVASVQDENELLSKNPSALLVEICTRMPAGLKESFLGVKTDDEASIRLWRKIADRWRKRTSAGAIAFNPSTGASGVVKTHRFTPEARRLAREAVTMWALGGKSFYEPTEATAPSPV